MEEAQDVYKRQVLREDDGRLRVQCFGNFEVFFGGLPLKFARSKTKELFAYLVNRRGAVCTVRELSLIHIYFLVFAGGAGPAHQGAGAGADPDADFGHAQPDTAPFSLQRADDH